MVGVRLGFAGQEPRGRDARGPTERPGGRGRERGAEGILWPLYSLLKGLTALMVPYICPSFRSSVRISPQPADSAAASMSES